MAAAIPIGVQRTPIDATKEAVFEFYSSGGDRVYRNTLEIWDTDDLSVVDEGTVYTNTHCKYYKISKVPYYKFDNTYDPSDSTAVRHGGLENGKTYYFRFDVNNAEYSEFLPILCLATPTFDFTDPFDGKVISASSYIFTLKYTQDNGEILNRVSFSLYNSLGVLVKKSETIYVTDEDKQDDGSYLIKYKFEGFNSGDAHSASANGVTVNGIELETKVSFTIEYDKPVSYSQFTVNNICDKGIVQIHSTLVSIIGSAYYLNTPYNNSNGNPSISDIPSYSESSKITDIAFDSSTIDLADKCLKWDLDQQSFSIKDKNFVMRMWLNPTRLCHLNSGMSYALCTFGSSQKDGFLIRWERIVENSEVKDLFSLSYLGGDTIVYKRSNKVSNLNNLSEVLIYIKKDGATLDLQLVPTKTQDNTFDFANSDVEYHKTTTVYYETSSVDQDLTDYDFVTQTEDISSLLSVQNSTISEVYLYNAIFKHFNVSSDTTITTDSVEPTDWETSTIMDCDFDNNINAGSVGKVADIDISAFLIKRREVGAFDWLTLAEKKISTISDLTFYVNDFLVPSNRDFEYALVPMLANGSEGDYLVQSVTTAFNGVFIFDKNISIRLLANVTYDSGVRNVSIGTLQPIGKKYPTIIQNGSINYFSGGVSGTVFNDEFYTQHTIDRYSISKLGQNYTNFLVNGNSKILKDWNGNIWIVQIVGSPSISYNQSTGNGVIDISFSWAEQGDWNNQDDLYNNGLIDVSI